MSHHHTSECSDCAAIEPFKRNYYFMGKLLVERDFTDEQRYYVDKLRLHHQRLHGHGVVCGLKVKAHDNPACRDRMICIEPGTAIDCCGHDILVLEPECFDFTALESFKAKIKPDDRAAHVLQICLRYQECPTEDIPVLFDDCGCDDTRCAPNRILESYTFDLIVDPPPAAEMFHAPTLAWHSTASPAHASGVALHPATHRLYVITADNKQTVFQLDTDNLSIVGTAALSAKGLALAVSNDGSRLYVVTQAPSGVSADPRQLRVLDTANNMSNPPISVSDLANSGDSDIFLDVTPDNRLAALVGKTGDVLIWPTTLDTASSAPAPDSANIGPNLRGLVISSNGQRAYSTDAANNSLPVLDLSATPPAPGTAITVLPAGAAPSQLTLVASTAADMLAVVSQTGQQLHLVALTPPAVEGTVSLTHAPLGLAVSTGGRWAYILEDDGADSYIEVIDLHRLRQNLPSKTGAPFKVGRGSREVVATPTGARLYAPFVDDLTIDNRGGVAVIEVSEEACEEILWRHLDGCPTCDMGDCVVLATIENYHYGDQVEDQTDPLADPEADAAADIARIDNRAGRRLLPSVQTLAEWIECLAMEGPGGAGQQGPPGQPGLGIDDVDVTSLPCENGVPAQATATLAVDLISGKRILHLGIPQGCEGKPGKDGVGLEADLTRIKALSWFHNRPNPYENAAGDPITIIDITRIRPGPPQGIVIGFTKEVLVGDPDSPGKLLTEIDASHVFQVLVEHTNDEEKRFGLICRCPIRGQIIPVKFTEDTPGHIISAEEVQGPEAPGVAFIFDQTTIIGKDIVTREAPDLWVILRGDFVIDLKKRAIDAEFVRAELLAPTFPGTGDHPSDSQFGVQGGLFESWFTLRQG